MNNPFAGANLDNIKEMNFSAVLKKIYERAGISRIELASSTEMSCAFVTKVLSRLTLQGIVLEAKNCSIERGRPKVSLQFNYQKYAMVGLRINGKYISSALCLANGEMLCHYSKDISEENDAMSVYRICCELISMALSDSNDYEILGIGIAAPGPLPVELDRITALSFLRIEGFSEIPLKKNLESEFGMPVILLHDAHCGALNEFIFSNDDEKYRNIVFIATDTGVGAGIIVDGKPYTGSGGLAGEIADMVIGVDGDFIKLGSVISYTKLIEQCGCKNIDEVASKIKNGDENTTEHFDRFVRYLAVSACNFVTTVSPQAIVISDRIALLSDRVEDICNEVFEKILPVHYRESFKLIVRPYNKHSVLRGACGAVLHKALEEPCKFFLK